MKVVTAGLLVGLVLVGCGSDRAARSAQEAANAPVGVPAQLALPASADAVTTTPSSSAAPSSPLPPWTPRSARVRADSTMTATTAVPATAPSTTVAATTTTTIPLPQPIAPPVEDGTRDPELLLGRIEIPAIEIDRDLHEGIRLPTLDDGPGHWPGTAMPGELGNSVIAGHRVSSGADFRRVDELVAGDEVIMTTDDGRFVYLVEKVEIVTPDALWVVNQTYEHRATLFACHPPGSVSERIVVHLRLTTE